MVRVPVLCTAISATAWRIRVLLPQSAGFTAPPTAHWAHPSTSQSVCGGVSLQTKVGAWCVCVCVFVVSLQAGLATVPTLRVWRGRVGRGGGGCLCRPRWVPGVCVYLWVGGGPLCGLCSRVLCWAHGWGTAPQGRGLDGPAGALGESHSPGPPHSGLRGTLGSDTELASASPCASCSHLGCAAGLLRRRAAWVPRPWP